MEPTEKQLTAIRNMASALEWRVDVPTNKQDASKLIGKMKEVIQNNLSGTGKINGQDNWIDSEYLNDIF